MAGEKQPCLARRPGLAGWLLAALGFAFLGAACSSGESSDCRFAYRASVAIPQSRVSSVDSVRVTDGPCEILGCGLGESLGDRPPSLKPCGRLVLRAKDPQPSSWSPIGDAPSYSCTFEVVFNDGSPRFEHTAHFETDLCCENKACLVPEKMIVVPE